MSCFVIMRIFFIIVTDFNLSLNFNCGVVATFIDMILRMYKVYFYIFKIY